MAIDYDILTAKEREVAEALGYEHKRKGRYGNVAKRTEYNGVIYDSKAEAEHAQWLDWQVERGSVAWWLRQVFSSAPEPDFKTRVDFLVATQMAISFSVAIEAHEVKGVEAREFKRVRKLLAQVRSVSADPRDPRRGEPWETIGGKV